MIWYCNSNSGSEYDLHHKISFSELSLSDFLVHFFPPFFFIPKFCLFHPLRPCFRSPLFNCCWRRPPHRLMINRSRFCKRWWQQYCSCAWNICWHPRYWKCFCLWKNFELHWFRIFVGDNFLSDIFFVAISGPRLVDNIFFNQIRHQHRCNLRATHKKFNLLESFSQMSNRSMALPSVFWPRKVFPPKIQIRGPIRTDAKHNNQHIYSSGLTPLLYQDEPLFCVNIILILIILNRSRVWFMILRGRYQEGSN